MTWSSAARWRARLVWARDEGLANSPWRAFMRRTRRSLLMLCARLRRMETLFGTWLLLMDMKLAGA